MLYTKRGDNGTTKTLRQKKGERISKASCQTEALGALDELNSFLGLVKTKSRQKGLTFFKIQGRTLKEITHEVQENLFIIQAEVAGADKIIKAGKIKELEKWSGVAERAMPPIKTFFISGGTELSALFDVARAFARRAERAVIRAVEASEISVGKHTPAYLNRLSSLCYALARLANFKAGIKEQSPKYQ
ncbi:MAG: ATP:cob(I)alamin adenosyltransferase [Candidatus Taylorbacteria bacterium RIFCSPHIGHO2_02_FULL_44_36]|uniref:Corrinoid adenosyltransferase n=1 Tax=Candidatus Taylorbacteria bacterium RIFCSPLOWO2_12_FULL_44_15c TaxID=1802333 RepID=A0A1G2P495_9BACT|nr:MAG: ATP:cob(I)alamin adenosyltransferase [Candidatus Taylorbacteria bacterium RIFCSPHIGHO2_02_FULL_44_36]OHA43083.1 MAG: ATP:cob(I)alamin adenosyltransferase [Candidatus Taylorbacteria bacterium RIFCSPLOWO2_12_FULL_44_15c]